MNDLRAEMQRAGRTAFPYEACGLIIGKGTKSLVIECNNVAEDKKNNFRIPARDYASASDVGEIIGIWHTHCEESNEPSDADRAGCEASELPWYIMSFNQNGDVVECSDVFAFIPSGFEMSYLERPYIFGTFDCYSLVMDYYKREYQIKLGNYPRIENWANLGHDFFVKNYEAEGFIRLHDEEPKEGDLFIMKTNMGNSNHIAIYIGDETILHHLHGRLSQRGNYSGFWQIYTTHHLRHKSKC